MKYSLILLFSIQCLIAQQPSPDLTNPAPALQSLDSKLIQIAVNVKDFGAKGDGVTDDTGAIQLAIQNASTSSGVAYIPPGTYVLSTVIISAPVTLAIDRATLVSNVHTQMIDIASSNVTIQGAGSAFTHLHTTDPLAIVIAIETGASQIGISGLWIEGGGFNFVGGVRAEGNGITVSGANGNTCPTRAANISVSENLFSQTNTGVYFRCVTDSHIANNVFLAANQAFTFVNLHSTNNTVITGNTGTTTGGASNAVELVPLADIPCTGNIISNNIFSGNFSFEIINLAGVANVVSGNTLTFEGVTMPSMQFGHAEAGVRIQEPGGGDTLSTTHHNTVTGNRISAPDATMAQGIDVLDTLSAAHLGAHDNLISNNTIHLSRGITIGDYCSRNQIINNDVDSTGYSACRDCDGISTQGANIIAATIRGNRVRGAARIGIYVNSSHDVDVSMNTVSNTQGLDPAGGHGIQVIGDRSNVVGNVTFSNTGWGIETFYATNLKLSSNQSFDNLAGQISFSVNNLLPSTNAAVPAVANNRAGTAATTVVDSTEIVARDEQNQLGGNQDCAPESTSLLPAKYSSPNVRRGCSVMRIRRPSPTMPG